MYHISITRNVCLELSLVIARFRSHTAIIFECLRHDNDDSLVNYRRELFSVHTAGAASIEPGRVALASDTRATARLKARRHSFPSSK